MSYNKEYMYIVNFNKKELIKILNINFILNWYKILLDSINKFLF